MLLTACQTSEVLTVEPGNSEQPAPQAAEPEPQSSFPIDRSLSREECALYYAIVGQMDLENRRTPNSILRGCPPEASVGAEIRPGGSQSVANGPKAAALRTKMADRGVPSDMIRQVVRSPAFRDWLQAAP